MSSLEFDPTTNPKLLALKQKNGASHMERTDLENYKPVHRILQQARYLPDLSVFLIQVATPDARAKLLPVLFDGFPKIYNGVYDKISALKGEDLLQETYMDKGTKVTIKNHNVFYADHVIAARLQLGGDDHGQLILNAAQSYLDTDTEPFESNTDVTVDLPAKTLSLRYEANTTNEAFWHTMSFVPGKAGTQYSSKDIAAMEYAKRLMQAYLHGDKTVQDPLKKFIYNAE
jgi:hypothetical protein